MATGIKKFSHKFLIEDSPWQFRLLAVIVLMFFGGGLLLDTWASNLSFPKPSGGSPALDQLSVEFLKAKHQSLTKSATLLYDLAKIVLGALIASITQSLQLSARKKASENTGAIEQE